jgi:hypothetical protein
MHIIIVEAAAVGFLCLSIARHQRSKLRSDNCVQTAGLEEGETSLPNRVNVNNWTP